MGSVATIGRQAWEIELDGYVKGLREGRIQGAYLAQGGILDALGRRDLPSETARTLVDVFERNNRTVEDLEAVERALGGGGRHGRG